MNNLEKRMVGDTEYEIKHSIYIGDKEVIFGENMNAKNDAFYLVSTYTQNEMFGTYENVTVSDDYLEAMEVFTGLVNIQIEKVKSEIEKINLPRELFTATHCVPHDYGQDINGKIVAIRADVFRHEYRRGDNQLVLVTGGSGASANSRGRAVFCKHFNDSSETRFNRQDVLGIVKPECVPDWAKERIIAMISELDKKQNSSAKPNRREEREER